uniref:Uncharacterized protein n=1 Tax=Oryza sativa subsp. japonica TaxID=39947 RepID=Q2QS29_ORYSJ|nr:hypothetical protein LOC_Os12g25540 [Oryza sativa Japonica Group]
MEDSPEDGRWGSVEAAPGSVDGGAGRWRCRSGRSAPGGRRRARWGSAACVGEDAGGDDEEGRHWSGRCRGSVVAAAGLVGVIVEEAAVVRMEDRGGSVAAAVGSASVATAAGLAREDDGVGGGLGGGGAGHGGGRRRSVEVAPGLVEAAGSVVAAAGSVAVSVVVAARETTAK